MYTIQKSEILLVSPASDLNNNLALNEVGDYVNAEKLAVIHDSFINIIPVKDSERRSRYVPLNDGKRRGQGFIKEVKWLIVRGECCLIVLSDFGLQIYQPDDGDVKFTYKVTDLLNKAGYLQGACSVNGNAVCVGSSEGKLWLFKSNIDLQFELINSCSAHESTVNCLDSNENYVVSAGKDELIILWSVTCNQLQKLRNLSVDGLFSNCTTILFSNYTILCGYESGEICIFDLMEQDFYIRDVAHLLQITSIDYAPLNNIVLTISQDAYIKVWKLEDFNIINVFMILNENGPLVGAKFLNMNGTEFVTATVNRNEVKMYIMNEDDNSHD